MKSENLYFLKLSDNDRIAESFRQAILYAHPDLENLEVDYDGKNLIFDFDGDIDKKGEVLYTVNTLVLKTTEKREATIDFQRIMDNTHEMMKSKFGDKYMEVLKNSHPFDFFKK